MINISVREENKIITRIEIKGHANASESGKDLVCAGVSAILYGCLNSLEEPNNFNIKIDEGYSLIEVKKEISSHDSIVIETLVKSLKMMQEKNTKYINFKN